jgi:tRNA U34 5-carboxymethylaminomethyl modifying GTPase MnmE/TrmE
LPAVGIAGAPNAGKSRLLNKLLGQERSIVSDERKTTRDVLTGLLTLAHCRCVLFDCAGLSILDSSAFAEASDFACATPDKPADKRFSILDELAQGATIEALQNASVVLFCVDISKDSWSEDVSIRRLVPRPSWPWYHGLEARDTPDILIPVATKCDLLSRKKLSERLIKLNELFGAGFLAASVKSGAGIEELRKTLDRKIIEMALGSKWTQSRLSETGQEIVAITSRHKQAVAAAIENINEAINELKAGNDEIAAMMLRTAYQAISDIQQPAYGRLDDEILERIFSRFCIGK